jgi:ABC-type antimicrobial peptide transport system permease subunit
LYWEFSKVLLAFVDDSNPATLMFLSLIVADMTKALLDDTLKVGEVLMRLATAIRSQVLAVDRDQPISNIATMDQIIESSMGSRRLTMLLLGLFAAVALLLATVGIYGAIAFSDAQRTQELGIRRALGAQNHDIMWLMLGQGLTLALI